MYLINGFRSAVDDCNLVDLGMQGHFYTWEKSRGTLNFTEERLDRVLVSTHWQSIFPIVEVLNIPMESSGHSAIFLHYPSSPEQRLHSFRFENAWCLEPKCSEIIKDSWGSVSDADFRARLKSCSSALQSWKETLRKQFRSEISGCRSRIGRLLGRRDTRSEQQVIVEK